MKHQVQTDQGPEPSSATYEPRSGASPSQPQSSSVKWGCATPPPELSGVEAIIYLKCLAHPRRFPPLPAQGPQKPVGGEVKFKGMSKTHTVDLGAQPFSKQ